MVDDGRQLRNFLIIFFDYKKHRRSDVAQTVRCWYTTTSAVSCLILSSIFACQSLTDWREECLMLRSTVVTTGNNRCAATSKEGGPEFVVCAHDLTRRPSFERRPTADHADAAQHQRVSRIDEEDHPACCIMVDCITQLLFKDEFADCVSN